MYVYVYVLCSQTCTYMSRLYDNGLKPAGNPRKTPVGSLAPDTLPVFPSSTDSLSVTSSVYLLTYLRTCAGGSAILGPSVRVPSVNGPSAGAREALLMHRTQQTVEALVFV